MHNVGQDHLIHEIAAADLDIPSDDLLKLAVDWQIEAQAILRRQLEANKERQYRRANS